MSEGSVKTAAGDSDEMADVRLIIDLIQPALAKYVANHADPRQAMAYMITALPLYAGTAFANLVFMGDMDQAQKARMAKACSHNFRQGVEVGLRRASRVMRETGAMGATQ